MNTGGGVNPARPRGFGVESPGGGPSRVPCVGQSWRGRFIVVDGLEHLFAARATAADLSISPTLAHWDFPHQGDKDWNVPYYRSVWGRPDWGVGGATVRWRAPGPGSPISGWSMAGTPRGPWPPSSGSPPRQSTKRWRAAAWTARCGSGCSRPMLELLGNVPHKQLP